MGDRSETGERAPVAAPPRPPRMTAAPASAVDPDELDPEFPDIDGVALEGVTVALPDARTLTVLRSRMRQCELEVGGDTTIDAQDAVFEDMDLTGRRLVGGLVRVRFERCRLGGVDFGTARLADVCFLDCVLDVASMRTAELERVVFDGGRIDGLDLSGARLEDVTIAGTSLNGVTLDRVRNRSVDLTAADLAGVTDVAPLSGCTIDQSQSILLAVRLARAAGIRVLDGNP